MKIIGHTWFECIGGIVFLLLSLKLHWLISMQPPEEFKPKPCNDGSDPVPVTGYVDGMMTKLYYCSPEQQQ